jgi:ribosomal protein S27E
MNKLSGVQKFIKMFVSEVTFAEMETESRAWKVKCGNCNHERSIWELGGIRYKASGNKKMYHACPNCGQRNWHTAYKQV